MTFWGVEVKLSLPHTSILLNYILKALFFQACFIMLQIYTEVLLLCPS